MCGIFGHHRPGGGDAAFVERMAQTLAHRGPDGYGLADFGPLVFGAGRLAIIDLASPAGPLFSEERQIAVVFNGEIYNYRSLRLELERAGHHFATHTDTEVIVHGYEEWGDSVLDRLRGMFAIGLWDARQSRLLLARDRQGEKPLYTATLGEEFLFASEIKALFDHPGLRPALNTAAVPHYLVVGYVPPPDTLYAGIHKLGPGEKLVYQAGRAVVTAYWAPHLEARDVPPYPEAVRRVRAMLTECVDMQMMSDVPIGAFLSGGVDSSAVVALMARASRQPINTFTVGFVMPPGSPDDDKFNVDLSYAAQVARHLGSRHHEIRLRADESLAELLPHLVYALDEPTQVATFVQTAYVTALARSQGVPVLLGGEAGDELFLGYNHFRADRALDRYLALPALLRDGLLNPLFERLPGGRFASLRKLARKSRQRTPAARYLEWSRYVDVERLPALLCAPALSADLASTLYPDLLALLAHPRTPYFADRIAYTNLRRVVGEIYNNRTDKMSMAMSVESRSPLEDMAMVDLAYSLPLSYKLRGGDFKRVFKDAVRDLVPASVLSRPKWGFVPPQSKWLRGPLRPLLEQVLAPERVEAVGVFRPDTVQQLVQTHLAGGYEMWPLWSLLVFHLWHELTIQRSRALPHKLSPADVVGLGLVSSAKA